MLQEQANLGNSQKQGGDSRDEHPTSEQKHLGIEVTSIPACRKNRCTEKNHMYFDFEHLKICAHFTISYNFL
jgi:hypothetical protein